MTTTTSSPSANPLLSQLSQLLQLLAEQGGTLETLQDRLASGALADLLSPKAKVDRLALQIALGLQLPLVQGFRGVTLEACGEIEIDTVSSREELIAAGGYTLVYSDSVPAGPGDTVRSSLRPKDKPGVSRHECALLGFRWADKHGNCLEDEGGNRVSLRRAWEIAAEIDRSRRWVPAGLAALLAFGVKHPEAQERVDILAPRDSCTPAYSSTTYIGCLSRNRTVIAEADCYDVQRRQRILLVRAAEAEAGS